MTKSQTWEQTQKILAELGLSKVKLEAATRAFEGLLAPKKGGIKQVIKRVDGVDFSYCRFTGLWFPLSEMIFQNDEKRSKNEHKGYSKIGISIWNKGQKYLKDLKFQSVEIAYGDDQSDETREKGLRLHQEAATLMRDNKPNDYHWLMDNFLSEEQADILESLELPKLS